MPSIDRPLSGPVLTFDLVEELQRTDDPAIVERSGRNARTLLKEGPLRVTLIVVGPGGAIPEHQAEGPITLQGVRGSIRFHAEGRDYELGPGQMLSAGSGVRHSVSSESGGAFLLTVVQP